CAFLPCAARLCSKHSKFAIFETNQAVQVRGSNPARVRRRAERAVPTRRGAAEAHLSGRSQHQVFFESLMSSPLPPSASVLATSAGGDTRGDPTYELVT